MVFPGVLTITDGAGHSNLDFLILSVSPNNTPTEFTLAVLYQTAGVYFPHFQASGQVSVRTNGTFDTQHPGFVIDGSTQVTAVPGPIAGAGLPGLVFASGGLLAWWRRRRS
jgi:hypothetical protein